MFIEGKIAASSILLYKTNDSNVKDILSDIRENLNNRYKVTGVTFRFSMRKFKDDDNAIYGIKWTISSNIVFYNDLADTTALNRKMIFYAKNDFTYSRAIQELKKVLANVTSIELEGQEGPICSWEC